MRILPFLFLALMTTSCTWINEYRVKGKAVTEQKNRIHTISRSLFELALPGNPRGNDFASVIVSRTEIAVTEVKESKEGRYSVVMKVTSVSPDAMEAIIKVVSPLSGANLNAFNFTDGLSLIKEKNPGMKMEKTEEVRVHTNL